MVVTDKITYHTHIVDIEHENETFSVRLGENDFGWDIIVLNVDTCDEMDDSDPLFAQLVDVAEQYIFNTPDTDSAGFTEGDR